VYDFGDHEMMEALRPSIEEAQPINSQQLALDYIGKRASQVGNCWSCFRSRIRTCHAYLRTSVQGAYGGLPGLQVV
jgi:hypothetical protein